MTRYGDSNDNEGNFIGRYIYLHGGPEEQDYLDSLCESWIETHKAKPGFYLVIDFETTGLDANDCEIVLASISWSTDRAVVINPVNFDLTKLKEAVSQIPIANHNIKFDWKFAKTNWGVEWNIFLCTLIGEQIGWTGYFAQGSYGLKSLAERYLPELKLEKEIRTEFPRMKKVLINGLYEWVGKEEGKDPYLNNDHVAYAAQDSMVTYRIVPFVVRRLIGQDLWHVWTDLEKKLIPIFSKVELEGINVDLEYANKLFEENSQIMGESLEELQKFASSEKLSEKLKSKFKTGKEVGKFNPKSGTQVLALMQAYGIDLPDTKAETLQAISLKHQKEPLKLDLIEQLRKYRETSSFNSKYPKAWISGQANLVTSRIHPHFNILTPDARTARLSATGPNIMAMPAPGRPFIKAEEGSTLLQFDYSQYEYRVAAGLAKEQTMIDAFVKRKNLLPLIKEAAHHYKFSDPDDFVKAVLSDKQDMSGDNSTKDLCFDFAGTDIHRVNGGVAFGVPPQEINGDKRSISKTLGYAVLYEAGAPTIQKQLAANGIYLAIKECQKLKENLLMGYPNLNKLIEAAHEAVLDPGFIETVFGRKKYFNIPPKWKLRLYNAVLAKSYREAGNSQMQMANVDALKMAIVELENAYTAYNHPLLKTWFCVHDEIVTNCPLELVDEISKLKEATMIETGERAADFAVPIEVSTMVKSHWTK